MNKFSPFFVFLSISMTVLAQVLFPVVSVVPVLKVVLVKLVDTTAVGGAWLVVSSGGEDVIDGFWKKK